MNSMRSSAMDEKPQRFVKSSEGGLTTKAVAVVEDEDRITSVRKLLQKETPIYSYNKGIGDATTSCSPPKCPRPTIGRPLPLPPKLFGQLNSTWTRKGSDSSAETMARVGHERKPVKRVFGQDESAVNQGSQSNLGSIASIKPELIQQVVSSTIPDENTIFPTTLSKTRAPKSQRVEKLNDSLSPRRFVLHQQF